MVPPLVCPPDGLPPLGVNRGSNRLEIIVAVILGGTLGVLLIRSGRGALAFDAVFLAGWLLATALHEIGHAVAAYARGFRVMAIFVGPVCIRRSARGIRLGLRRVPLGGKVYAGPRRWDSDARFLRDAYWFIGAGPGVSLLAGAIGLLVSRTLSIAWDWSLISLVIGAVTLIPARYPSGRSSDGEKLWQLRQASPAELRFMALRMMMIAIRPRDLDPALVAVASAESETQGSEAIDATWLLYYRALDSGDIAGAGTLLQRLVDYTCGSARWPRTTISVEVAFEASLFEAVWRDDTPAAREWLARAPFQKRGSAKFIEAVLDKDPKALAKLQRRFERLSSSSSS